MTLAGRLHPVLVHFPKLLASLSVQAGAISAALAAGALLPIAGLGAALVWGADFLHF